ncbi:DUF5317 family protein [Anaerobium acetethylicum]|uniref:Uncharacterized protein n=1 Tax=Anaerobium acetethylicum TaxID=1619234 RepID=A0A1D3TXB7_9FIRM|nr:DUF5317 family protein [Anaerobium acetethylicum]SCP98977.1 hypothetical protein SAMN05421730_10309 [Anaerobium acetethylicum]
MFLDVILAVAYAKIKGYRIKPALKSYFLYPFMAVEILSVFLQICIFMKNYTFVQYTGIIQNIYLYTLIIPIFAYRLYKPGIIGSALILTGTFLNRFVMSQNAGKMPVYVSLSKITGYVDEAALQSVDNIHIIGSQTANYKFLADFIDIGYSILSIGDVLIHSFIFIVIYYTIKEINVRQQNRD